MEYKKFDTPTVIHPDGQLEELTPENGKAFSLEELQKIVGGSVQLVELPNKLQVWVNEEGKLNNLPYNAFATLFWRTIWYGYNLGADDCMVGPVLLCEAKFTEDED